jgi:hypothetical protein
MSCFGGRDADIRRTKISPFLGRGIGRMSFSRQSFVPGTESLSARPGRLVKQLNDECVAISGRVVKMVEESVGP